MRRKAIAWLLACVLVLGLLPAVSARAEEPAFAGNGTEEDPYLLQTASDFTKLDRLTEEGESFAGICFLVTADIEMPEDWNGIGSMSGDGGNGTAMQPFSGILDGGGHTLTFPFDTPALFDCVREAAVRNVKIYGEYINTAGLVANYVVDYGEDGDPEVGTGGSFHAGCPDTIDVCNVIICSGSVIRGAGMIGGYASGGNVVNIRDCVVEANVKIGYDAILKKSAGESAVGSFGGAFNGTIANCTSAATVYGNDYVGGLVGAKGQAQGPYTVTNSSFTGSVEAEGSFAGGIAGGGYCGLILGVETAPNTMCATIQNCYVQGSVSGKTNVGGITGGEEGCTDCPEAAYVRSNCFYGTVSASEEEGTVGGVIGYLNSVNDKNKIADNYYRNSGKAESGIGRINPEGIHVDTDPAGNGAEALAKAVTAQELTDGTVVDLLNHASGSFCNWVQGENGPVFGDMAVVYELVLSGSCKTEYVTGEELDLNGLVVTAIWSNAQSTEVDAKELTVSGYRSDIAGVQTVTLEYRGVQTKLTVTVKKPEGTARITFCVFGDSLHDSEADGQIHTMRDGTLEMWLAPSEYAVDANASLLDIFEDILKKNGMSCQIENGTYVRSVTRNGVTLEELGNGPGAGWMFTVNGEYPQQNAAQLHPEDGDVIVFHYTDDNAAEQDKTEEIRVNVTVCLAGEVVLTQETVAVADRNSDGIYDVDEALYAAHEAAFPGGAKAGYASSMTAYGLSLTKLWGDEGGAYGYWKNDASCWSLADPVSDGDYLTAFTYSDPVGWSDAYARFDRAVYSTEREVTVGLEKAGYDADWNTVFSALPGADITVYDSSREAVDPNRYAVKDNGDGTYTVTFYEDGEYFLIAKEETPIVPAVCRVNAAAALKESNPAEIYQKTGDCLEKTDASAFVFGTEWMVLGLARSGRTVPEEYYSRVVSYVQETIRENGQLSRSKSTENSRLILALTALGYDVTDVGGHNLLEGLTQMSYLKKQGLNGVIWALLAFNSHNYTIPAGDVTREGLEKDILAAQLSDGGWAMSGNRADADLTAMAILALAPRYETDSTVRNALDRAVTAISGLQREDGGYDTFGPDGSRYANCESTAQVIMAVTALGINPETDSRFVKNGCSVLDALCEYASGDGGFCHLPGGQTDTVASVQGYAALTAYFRMTGAKTALYDMSDVAIRSVGENVPGEGHGEVPGTGDTEAGFGYAVWMIAALGCMVILFVSNKKDKIQKIGKIK